MDIRYEKPIGGGLVLQAMRFEAGAAIAVGTLVVLSSGTVVAAGDAVVNAVGYAVSASTASGQFIQVIPFLKGHVYSCPAVADVIPGDVLEYDLATDDFVESATAPMAVAVPNDQVAGLPDERTMFTITAGLLA